MDQKFTNTIDSVQIYLQMYFEIIIIVIFIDKFMFIGNYEDPNYPQLY